MVFAVTSCNGIIICYTGIDGYSLQQENSCNAWLVTMDLIFVASSIAVLFAGVLSVVSLF